MAAPDNKYGLRGLHISVMPEETVRPECWVTIVCNYDGDPITVWNGPVHRTLEDVLASLKLVLAALTDRGPLDAHVVAVRFFSGKGLAS